MKLSGRQVEGSFRVTEAYCAGYFAAAGAGFWAGGVFWAARSFSTALLQPALRLALCLFMHASVA